MNFASWPFRRILVISAIWFLLAIVYRALEVFFALRQLYETETAGGAAISIGFGAEWLILLVAPIFFIFAWGVAQLMRSDRRPDNSRLR